jgi:periplasmic protein TonB
MALRLPISFALALALICTVFFGLFRAIDVHFAVQERQTAQRVEFSRLRRDTETQTMRRQKVERERPQQAVATPRMATVRIQGSGERMPIAPPTVDARVGFSQLQVSVGGSDRDVIPLVRIEPEYPRRAAQRGQEGYVVVRFTITPAGTIRDAEVVDSKPTGVFDREAIRAVERWKYNPKVEEGVAVERRGVQVRLTFKLER